MSALKTEAQAGDTALGFGEITSADTPDCASGGDERKAFETLRAKFALKGFALCWLHDRTLVVERWGFTRVLNDLTQAAQFLAQIGGRH